MEQHNSPTTTQDNPEGNPNFAGTDNTMDTATAANSAENEAEAPENLAVKLQADLDEQKDKYIRLFAEFDNYKRRTAKERIELMQTAGKEVIGALLDVLDDSERAEKQFQSSTDLEELKQGVQLVFAKLKTVLQAKGLKAMESVNTDFDVEKHEAITEIPAPTPEMAGKVIDDVQKGYYLNDKIIRFAKVVVGK